MTSHLALKPGHVVAALSFLACLVWASSASALVAPPPPPADGCDAFYQTCMDEAWVDRSLCIGGCVDEAISCRKSCPPGAAGILCRVKCLKNYWRCRSKCMKGYSAAAKQCKLDLGDCQACEPSDAWDPELGACCNEPIWIADCWCPEGFEYTSFEEYHDNGCLAGIGCGCEPGKCSDGSELLCDMLPPECGVGMVLAVIDNCYQCVDAETCSAGPQACEEWEVWDEELHACCPGAIWIADCWCPPGWEYTSWEETDENGCLEGYACGCEPGVCSDGSELTCKMMEPQCAEGEVLAVIDGCYQCLDPETCAPSEPECKDGDKWDEEVGACCPEAIWVADCLCEAGYTPISVEEYDDAGCLLGYGCECVPDK